MIDRRLFICGCGASITLHATSTYGQQSQYRGCWLTDEQLEGRVGSATPTLSFDLERDQIQNGSGNRLFDRALARTLAKLVDQFSVLPGFGFFEDRTSRNAFASPSNRLGRADGSVVFGKLLFQELMAKPQNPELGIAAVCAHEFGHIAQFKLGIEKRLVGADGRVKRLELHADFLTGYFAGKRKLELPSFPAAMFAQTQYDFGDNNFGSRGHHGTNEERGNAVVAGFEAAYRDKLEFGAAIERGIQYVMAISP